MAGGGVSPGAGSSVADGVVPARRIRAAFGAVGPATLVIDQRFLTLGFRQMAEAEWARTPPNIRTAFESYTSGVNAAMSVSRARLPIEHQLLGLWPEPWTPVDSLAISKLFSWRLGENHRAELLRYSLGQALGPRAAELFPAVPDWAPSILETRGKPAAQMPRAALGHLPGLEWLSPDAHAMSNSWVVHGSRTASGRPILANDPHLQIEMPGVWWEVHVVSDTLNVTGRHHSGHSVHHHRPQRAAWLGPDERRHRRAGFFHRAAGSITAEISGRRGMGAPESAAARDSRQRSRRAGDLRRPLDAPWTGAESRSVARNVCR